MIENPFKFLAISTSSTVKLVANAKNHSQPVDRAAAREPETLQDREPSLLAAARYISLMIESEQCSSFGKNTRNHRSVFDKALVCLELLHSTPLSVRWLYHGFPSHG